MDSKQQDNQPSRMTHSKYSIQDNDSSCGDSEELSIYDDEQDNYTNGELIKRNNSMLEITTTSKTQEDESTSYQCTETALADGMTKKEGRKKKKNQERERDNAVSKSLAQMKLKKRMKKKK